MVCESASKGYALWRRSRFAQGQGGLQPPSRDPGRVGSSLFITGQDFWHGYTLCSLKNLLIQFVLRELYNYDPVDVDSGPCWVGLCTIIHVSKRSPAHGYSMERERM